MDELLSLLCKLRAMERQPNVSKVRVCGSLRAMERLG